MKEFVCIVCPRGCRLKVDTQTLEVSGNSCPKGEEYGKGEVKNPKRTVTTTVAIENAVHQRLPVRTDIPVPKEKMFEIMLVLHRFETKSPIKRGQILIENICKTNANIIATRDM